MKNGHVGSTSRVGQPCNLAGQPCFLLALPLDTLSITTSSGHIDKTISGNVPTHGRPVKVMWPTGHTLAWLSPCLLPRDFFVSYYL
jgi:hypothetical protein